MDAFDADVLIYAAVDDHPLGRRIRALFATEPGSKTGVGSVLLPETRTPSPTSTSPTGDAAGPLDRMSGVLDCGEGAAQ